MYYVVWKWVKRYFKDDIIQMYKIFIRIDNLDSLLDNRLLEEIWIGLEIWIFLKQDYMNTWINFRYREW